MLCLKPGPARAAQVVGADQALYLESKLKPEQKDSLRKKLCLK